MLIFYFTGTFSVVAHRFEVPFPKLLSFFEIFWTLLVAYSLYKKPILGIFIYLFIYEVTTTKVNFRFYKQCRQTTTHFICK